MCNCVPKISSWAAFPGASNLKKLCSTGKYIPVHRPTCTFLMVSVMKTFGAGSKNIVRIGIGIYESVQ